MEEFKTLIVYYSRTGNTKVGGILVQIETKEPRPEDYRTKVSKEIDLWLENINQLNE